ncbi:MAG: ABC transporter ATP-binding protein [Deltaproteobacteria bacterium]|nr:ABC transporter ATP-binding protein [Deltaproteobacteria bacterium]
MIDRPLLQVENLCTYFKLPKPHLFGKAATVFAVDDISFEISRGQTFGLVGESGCGKSTTAMSVLRLVEPTSGSVKLDNQDIGQLKGDELRSFRRHMQIVFQDPYSSMNPRATACEIVEAPLKIQRVGTSKSRRTKVAHLFKMVGLRPEQRDLFPHQFSGGQRQRIAIARALASGPQFIVCDEPVSALDVAIQAQILNLLRRLQEELNLTYLFISHDMAIIQHMCDHIAVMYMGQIVETADRRSLFLNVQHPYTKALLSAIPTIDFNVKPSSKRLEGDVPSPMDPPEGCRFHTRCPMTEDICKKETPLLRAVKENHFVACHLV